jgi:hypothetical protein
MPGALENLQEIRDRMGDLPNRVADILRQSDLTAPVTPAGAVEPLTPAAAAGAIQQAISDLPQPATPAFSSFEPAPLASFNAAGYPPVPLPSQLGLAAPGIDQAAAPAQGLSSYPAAALGLAGPLEGPQPSAAGISDLQLAGPSSGGSEVVRLLRQLVDAGSGTAVGRQPAGRIPNGPQRVAWSSVWEPPGEGYSSQSSPSLDVSNIAGAGGASSLKGYGSYGHPGRYWASEGEDEVPR